METQSQKILHNKNIDKMINYVLELGMLHTYVDEHAYVFGGLSFTNPEECFNIYLYDIDFKKINVDLNKADVTFLDVLKAIPFCKKVEFEMCRPTQGAFETLIIE